MATLTNSLCRGDGSQISLQVIASDAALLNSSINIATSSTNAESVSIGNNLGGKVIYIDGGTESDLSGSAGVNIGAFGGESISIGGSGDSTNSVTNIFSGQGGINLYSAGGIIFDPFNTNIVTITGGIGSAPVNSSVATSAFVTSLTAGTSVKNNNAYNLLCNICVNITAATAATITLGVGSATGPTANTVVSTFTTAAVMVTNFSAIVPANYYLVVNTTGTITVGSISVQSCPM